MGDANATQVGGNHYRSGYQHWDFVRELQLDYLQGCATKYVARWRKKNGREDLEKARHYIIKRQESRIPPKSAGNSDDGTGAYWGPHSGNMSRIWAFGLANDLTVAEARAIYSVVLGEWDDALTAVDELLAKACPVAEAVMPELREKFGEELDD